MFFFKISIEELSVLLEPKEASPVIDGNVELISSNVHLTSEQT